MLSSAPLRSHNGPVNMLWRLWLCTLVQFGVLAGALPLRAAALPQEIYVWQRAWTEPVRQAVAEHGEAFTRVVALKAEVTWHEGKPELVQVPVDYRTLQQTKRPIGLALRVGPYTGSFAPTNAAALYLGALAQSLVAEAKTAGVTLSELQLDFDCATAKLEGYRRWVEVIQKRIAPTPLVITALPAWLEAAPFKALAQTTGAYVLQVHSLERPKSFEAPFTLCDPAAARRAVARASALGVPFRVALPTYGYVVAFDSRGRFIGLSAEGPAKSWPAGAQFKEVRADALALAPLVRDWSARPPPGLMGLLWYRFSVAGDTLNWRWPTLQAMLAARIPQKNVRAESHRVEPGLVEISLVNDGELDISSRFAVTARWRGARLVAGDGLHGYELAERGVNSARLKSGARPGNLSAGDKQVIGWLRLSDECEVQVELEERDGQ